VDPQNIELLTVHELAQRLCISPLFIHARLQKNHPDRLPFVRLGKQVRFRITDIIRGSSSTPGRCPMPTKPMLETSYSRRWFNVARAAEFLGVAPTWVEDRRQMEAYPIDKLEMRRCSPGRSSSYDDQ